MKSRGEQLEELAGQAKISIDQLKGNLINIIDRNGIDLIESLIN